MSEALQTFLQKITESYKRSELIKIILGNKKDKNAPLKNVLIKPVLIKNQLQLSFTYRHNTQDMVKNYPEAAAMATLQQLLEQDFYNADAFTQTSDYQLTATKDHTRKLVTKPASQPGAAVELQHNRTKQYKINTHAAWLQQLGITTADGVVKKDMQDKYKQISHYIEIIDGIIKDTDFDNSIRVADMGSGKGYLTFALYDHLVNSKSMDATMYGVELRDDLVTKCNAVAAACQYKQLTFLKGSIEAAAVPAVDMLIALHACDTATDDAIYRGIKDNAKVIVCAPCCHKQIRKQMAPGNALKSITKHGILLERQAEMVTDAIRALLLEACGYKTKVFDFISTEHTPKNVMIAAVKSKVDKVEKDDLLKKVEELKNLFNIKYHYLEKQLLNL
jgi:Methyltransferase domain